MCVDGSTQISGKSRHLIRIIAQELKQRSRESVRSGLESTSDAASTSLRLGFLIYKVGMGSHSAHHLSGTGRTKRGRARGALGAVREESRAVTCLPWESMGARSGPGPAKHEPDARRDWGAEWECRTGRATPPPRPPALASWFSMRRLLRPPSLPSLPAPTPHHHLCQHPFASRLCQECFQWQTGQLR